MVCVIECQCSCAHASPHNVYTGPSLSYSVVCSSVRYVLVDKTDQTGPCMRLSVTFLLCQSRLLYTRTFDPTLVSRLSADRIIDQKYNTNNNKQKRKKAHKKSFGPTLVNRLSTDQITDENIIQTTTTNRKGRKKQNHL